MANILPVSDLKNYNEVLKNCHKGEWHLYPCSRYIKTSISGKDKRTGNGRCQNLMG